MEQGVLKANGELSMIFGLHGSNIDTHRSQHRRYESLARQSSTDDNVVLNQVKKYYELATKWS